MNAADAPSATEGFVERFAQAWADPTPEALAALVHPDTQNRYPGLDQPVGRTGVEAYFRTVLDAMPDMTLRVDRWVAQEDTVWIEWTATARKRSWSGVDIATLRGDREMAAVIYFDTQQARRALPTD